MLIKRQVKKKRYILNCLLFTLVIYLSIEIIRINGLPLFKYFHDRYTKQLAQRSSLTSHQYSTLCSRKSTLRGFNQKIISISLFGPKENKMYTRTRSIRFLNALISDMYTTYPDWILRVYHDLTIEKSFIRSIENKHSKVDFCNIHSMNLDYIPPRMWRFLPAGDDRVEVMNSRDLDSPLTERELAAVLEWLKSNISFHVMRDHPQHGVPVLAGMWGFRPQLNPSFSKIFLYKLLDRNLSRFYEGNGDQGFLEAEIWPNIRDDVFAHDSFHCKTQHGYISKPFPTRRSVSNTTYVFVGCLRPCTMESSQISKCPRACRPKKHKNWTMC